MPGPGPGPGQAARRPHDPRMRGTDPRQQAQPRPVQQIPQQQPQPQAQPQQNAAANLPAEQQKGESASMHHMGRAPTNNLPHASANQRHLTIPQPVCPCQDLSFPNTFWS